MYPEFLKDNKKIHWEPEEIFRKNKIDWIHAFVEDDYNIGMHTQGFFEINIVLKGKGRHYVENQSLDVVKGDSFIIPPNVRHGYVGGEGFDVYHTLINQRFLEKYIADLQTLPFFFTLFNIEPLMRISGSAPLHLKIKGDQFDRIEYLINSLMKWSFPENTVSAIMCNSTALMLITQLCAIYAENYSLNGVREETECDAAFMESVALIYEKYYEKITIERLAKTAKLSRTAYIGMFKHIMGTTPARFILTRRLEMAKTMLTNTELPIADVAEKTGFYDSAHFIRCFTAHSGRLPLEFRKSNN